MSEENTNQNDYLKQIVEDQKALLAKITGEKSDLLKTIYKAFDENGEFKGTDRHTKAEIAEIVKRVYRELLIKQAAVAND